MLASLSCKISVAFSVLMAEETNPKLTWQCETILRKRLERETGNYDGNKSSIHPRIQTEKIEGEECEGEM